ncbi:hypothetical protein HMI54_002640 [Coelomomyces lativittatus]|nr:hypothetical protein HMI54_002640 [Coelomomyces lativittatus]KAJ1509749.1 hypothetical protein HMI55_007271 [Coelomomyces lativittatus]KAJ1512733.1 hypothetical protein HMI56_003624 [Coelomomyces lativittatus]
MMLGDNFTATSTTSLPLSHDPSQHVSGPFLLFRGTFENIHLYSLLLVYPPSMLSLTPVLSLLSHGTLQSIVKLDTVFHFTFWRLTFSIPVSPDVQCITYQVDALPSFTFYVPGEHQAWRFVFYSCNGLSLDVAEPRKQKYNGIQPLWNAVWKEHLAQPIHLLIGGGDQLYFDAVFEVVPGLNTWARMPSNPQRKEVPFDEEMERGVAWFYLNHYLHGFMEGVLAHVLRSIPSCMSWDDHDIFDGWGSYPDYLHQSLVFQGIFHAALRFYLLFQHHTTPLLANADGYLGHPGFHRVVQCGASMALLLPDTRTERTLDTVVTSFSWDAMFHALHHLPTSSLRHVLLVAPVPMVYPPSSADPLVNALGTSVRAVSSMVHSIGKLFNENVTLNASLIGSPLYKSAVNRFGEPELLDDLRDHWTHGTHVEEKQRVLLRLVSWAQQHRGRVTVLSGDVHLATVGLTYASHHRHDPHQFLPFDPCGMFQIVSSAIANVPPPPLVASGLSRNLKEMKLDDGILERMLEIFKVLPDGQVNPTPCFLRRRNFALGQVDEHEMRIWICAEKVKGDLNGETMKYLIHVPDLQ